MGGLCPCPPSSAPVAPELELVTCSERFVTLELNEDVSQPIDFHLYRGTHVCQTPADKDGKIDVRLDIITQKEGEREGNHVTKTIWISEKLKPEDVNNMRAYYRAMKKNIDDAYKEYLRAKNVQEAVIIEVEPLKS